MLPIPEHIKQIFRNNNSSLESWRGLEISFFDSAINMLYPSNDLYPSETLYPIGTGEPWLVLTDKDISSESLYLIESLSSSPDILFGSCEASLIEFIVTDVEAQLEGKEFTAVLSVGDYKMAYGIYTVESVERQADRTKKKIVALDRMIKFDRSVANWYHSMYLGGSEVYTIKELRDSLCEYIGVPQQQVELVNDSLRVGKTVQPDVLKGRDVLMAICEINGCFGHVDRTGVLTYKTLQETGLYPDNTLFPAEDLYPHGAWESAEVLEHYQDIRYEDYMVNGIDRVQIRQEEGDIGAVVGAGVNAYTIQGNFLAFGLNDAELTQLAWSIYDVIGGKTYRPCRITSYAMPWVEPGDGVYAMTTDDEVATFVLERTMKGFQAMKDTIVSKGRKERLESFGLNTQLIQLQGKSAVIKKTVEEVSVRVTDLKEYTEAQFVVTSNAITAEVTRAKEAESQLRITADSISARVTNLKNDTEAKFVITDQKISAKVSKGTVTAELNIEPGVINLRANRITWQSDYSSMTANGILTCKGIRAENGYFTGTLETDIFYAGNEEVIMGDYTVSANNTGALLSSNGYVEITQRATSGPSGNFARLTVGGSTNRTAVKITGNGAIVSEQLETGWIACHNDIRFPDDSWVAGWSLLRMLKNIYDRIESLENR